MSLSKKWIVCAATAAIFMGAGCHKKEAPSQGEEKTGAAEAPSEAGTEAKAPETEASAEGKTADLSQLDRATFNRAAVRLNLPIFWTYEAEPSKTVRPEALTTLNFYPTSETFVWKDSEGKFTQAFYDAYGLMVEVMKDPLMGATVDAGEKTRRLKVAEVRMRKTKRLCRACSRSASSSMRFMRSKRAWTRRRKRFLPTIFCRRAWRGAIGA